MKYLQSGGYQNQPLMRLTLGLSLALLAAFWVTNVAMWFAHMSLDPASIVAYYRGDEARFLPPRSALGMLEVTHMHLPMFALVLLLLTHLMLFAPMGAGRKAVVVVAAFGSALLMEAGGWLVRFVHPGFAWLQLAMFVVFQGVLGGLIVALGVFLARGERSGRRRRGRREHAGDSGHSRERRREPEHGRDAGRDHGR
jgi:hypothetical protein